MLRGLYESKVTFSLIAIQRPGLLAHNCKMVYWVSRVGDLAEAFVFCSWVKHFTLNFLERYCDSNFPPWCTKLNVNMWLVLHYRIEWFQLCVESTVCLTVTMILVLVLDSNWFAFLFFFMKVS